MLHAVFIFADSLDRANFFTRNRYINNCMVRTVLVAFAATDTSVMVNPRLSVLFELDGVFRTVHITATRHTTTAEVRYFIVYLYTGGTCFIHHAHQVLFLVFRTEQRPFSILGERCQFVNFVLHIKTQKRKCLVFPYGTFLMNAATAYYFRFTGTQLYGQTVNLVEQTIFLPKFN